jgi:hypothetical protein
MLAGLDANNANSDLASGGIRQGDLCGDAQRRSGRGAHASARFHI